jgi:hypothetical protein
MKFRDKKVMNLIISAAGIILFAYFLFCLGLYFNQDKILYHPYKEIESTPSELLLEFEDIEFESSDGVKLNGWFIPAEKTEFTVLLCHGNAGNISHRLATISILNEVGVNTFIFDYRGFGGSEGKPDEKGTYLDAKAAYTWLTEQKKIPSEKIIIFGRSLGGAVAAHLASTNNPAGVVLESTFTSYIEAGKAIYPYLPIPKFFAKYRYDTLSYIKKIESPVMLIHSTEDELIPFRFAETLYENASEPKRLIEITGDHNNGFYDSQPKYTRAWENWLNSLEK